MQVLFTQKNFQGADHASKFATAVGLNRTLTQTESVSTMSRWDWHSGNG